MDIATGNIIKIKPTPDACRRTRQKISKYGAGGFEIISFSPRSQYFGGTPAVLLRAVYGPDSRYEKWTGWIPLLEVDDE
tara:strand:- start:285 stop:521 length:237 start_codon:yes stop_codon:yes gene_type:complete